MDKPSAKSTDVKARKAMHRRGNTQLKLMDVPKQPTGKSKKTHKKRPSVSTRTHKWHEMRD